MREKKNNDGEICVKCFKEKGDKGAVFVLILWIEQFVEFGLSHFFLQQIVCKL